MNERMDAGPIFIVGSARSGTTLLRLMLTSHPDICIPPESPFLVRLRKKYSKFKDLTSEIDSFVEDLFSEVKFNTEWQLEKECVRANLRKISPLNYHAAASTVYWTYLDTFFPNARIWGDKNPAYLRHIDTILEDFPTAKFIHIIRDIRSIYASLVAIHEDEVSRPYWSKMHSPLPFATQQWHLAYEVFEKTKANPHVYTLFYERLVSDPEQVLNALCRWLGIAFHESMLEFYRFNKEKQLVADFVLKWEQKTLEAVDESRVNNWRNELDAAQIHAIETLNRQRMLEMGYKPVTRRVSLRALSQIFLEYSPILKKEWKKYFMRYLFHSWWKPKR
ncbi:sulfotransferase [bacterium]|nr:sulfotransferase [bacterium]